MRIAVFGRSINRSKRISPIDNKASIEDLCRQIGSVLATSSHRVLVESDTNETADRLVVEGLLEAGPRLNGQVVVYPRDRNTRPFTTKQFAKYSSAFRFEDTGEALLGPVHLRMLRDSDIALVLGGGEHSYHAGLMAAGMGKRVLPLPAFGGAARDLYSELESEFDIDRPAMRLPNRERWKGLTSRTPAGAVKALFEEINRLPAIMIVHGRDSDRKQLTKLLKNVGADPRVVAESFGAGDTIPRAFIREASGADGAIVLLTPDDKVTALRDPSGQLAAVGESTWRARQNVILEIGWFWGRLGLDRTLLLFKGDVEEPTDLLGVFHETYTNEPKERVPKIRGFIDQIHHGRRM